MVDRDLKSKIFAKSDLLKTFLLVIAYVVSAKFGLAFGAVSGFATLIWPPTGMAFAALVLGGKKLWPGIALGAFIVNMWVGAPALVALGIAVGNTLEALLGAFIFLNITHSRVALDRLRSVVVLVSLVAVLSTLVSATMGAASLYMGRSLSAEAFGRTWWAWWIGDVLSDLVVAPFLLVWSQLPRFRKRIGSLFEGIVLGILVLSLSIFIFGPGYYEIRPYGFLYFIFPLLMWTTVRYGTHANTFFVFSISVIAIWGTILGYGPFQAGALTIRLLSLELFVASVSLTGLFFGALGREKEAAIRLRSEFLSIASHELKTPLTSMKLQVQMARQGLDSKRWMEEPERLAKVLESSERQVDRLAKLVDDLLDISRIQSGRLQIFPDDIDISSLLVEVLERFHSQIIAANCVLNVSIVSSIRGHWDRYRIEQVIINLLTNSLKYGQGKAIEVSLKSEGKSVFLLVRDFGIGIAKKNHSRIFEPFERAFVGQKISGLGLGLYISKQIVEAHAGSIRVESEEGNGSTFTVELPMDLRV